MLGFLKAILGLFAAVGRGFVTAVSAIARATTWPARWAIAKTKASRFGLWIWSLTIDPPAVRGVYLVLFLVALPVIGAVADRKLVRGDLAEKALNLEGRLLHLGQMNIACNAERGAWEARALTAETKYEELVKRDPPSPGSPAAIEAAEAACKKTPLPSRPRAKKVSRTAPSYFIPY